MDDVIQTIKNRVESTGKVEFHIADGTFICEILKSERYTINFYSIKEPDVEWELEKSFKRTTFPSEEWFDAKIKLIVMHGLINFF